jgi:hypothetical protein
MPVDEQARVRRARAAYDAALAEARATDPGPTGNRADHNDMGGDAGGGDVGGGDVGGGDVGGGDVGGGDVSGGDVSGGSHRAGGHEQSRSEKTRGEEPGPRLWANLTDPDSRLLKTRNGWIQGYNGQLSRTADEFILTARVTQDANDTAQFAPTAREAVSTAAQLTARTGRTDLVVGTMIGDAGYDTDDNLTVAGPDRLIADAKRHIIDRRAATEPTTGDPPEDASPREKMNHRLRTAEGHALYRQRSHMIEPVNAWLKDGRGLRQFPCRGLEAAQADLSLGSAVTNVLKLRAKGVTTQQLRNA